MFSKLLKPFLAEDLMSPAMVWLMVAFIVIMAALGPMLFIQALNILFGLSIPFNLQTWCSVVILHAFITTAVK
jgi:hypothetical protein